MDPKSTAPGTPTRPPWRHPGVENPKIEFVGFWMGVSTYPPGRKKTHTVCQFCQTTIVKRPLFVHRVPLPGNPRYCKNIGFGDNEFDYFSLSALSFFVRRRSGGTRGAVRCNGGASLTWTERTKGSTSRYMGRMEFRPIGGGPTIRPLVIPFDVGGVRAGGDFGLRLTGVGHSEALHQGGFSKIATPNSAMI